MASNAYYGGNGNGDNRHQQHSYGQQDPSASYGANYGQGHLQQQPQTFAQQTYADGSREQKYDQQGNPVLPNGERGLLGDLAGAAGGAFLGHKAGGHSILGAIAGGISAHLIGDAMQKPNKNGQYPRPQQQGGFGQLFGRRDIDGNQNNDMGGPGGQSYPNQNQFGGQSQQGDSQFQQGPGHQGGPHHQGGAHQHQQHQQHQQHNGGGQPGFGGPNDQTYGRGYGGY